MFQDNYENIPRFHDDDNSIPNIPSEEFLTPFMKNLKNKRKNLAPDENPEENATYDNVINFLDNIENIANTPKEIHFARLHNFPQIVRTTEIEHLSVLEHSIVRLEVDKPSCLRKSDEAKTKKKVSFFVLTEEKANQADICPHHRIKTLKTSSEQFPPLENLVQQDRETLCTQIENEDNQYQDAIDSISNETSVDKAISCDSIVCQNFVNVDNFAHKSCEAINENSEDLSETRSESLSRSKSSDPYILEDPKITVYYDEFAESKPQVVVKNTLSSVKKKKKSTNNCQEETTKKPKIVLFRELSHFTNMLTPFKTFHNFAFLNENKPKENTEEELSEPKLISKCTKEDENTIIFLKSLYAVVYILMFTALNLEYTCVYN